MPRSLTYCVDDRVQIATNVVAGLVFAVLIPVALTGNLKKSVPFLVFLSLWALVAAHWSGALAAWAKRESAKETERLQGLVRVYERFVHDLPDEQQAELDAALADVGDAA